MVSSLALFVALSGAALAVEAVTKNSVSSKSIRKGAVRSVDVKNGDLRGADIDESTLDPVPAAENVLGVTVTPDANVAVSTRQPPPFVVKAGNSYRVTFDHSVAGCVPVAATTASTPPPPVSAGLVGAGSPNGVAVVTSNPTDAFILAVVC
jgi:hypothetical protein